MRYVLFHSNLTVNAVVISKQHSNLNSLHLQFVNAQRIVVMTSMTTPHTCLFAYGFPPMGVGKVPAIIKKISIHHIETTTGLKVINNEINFISGNVWDHTRDEFDRGLGANIMVEGTLTKANIQKINDIVPEFNMFRLIIIYHIIMVRKRMKILLVKQSKMP